MAYFKDLSRYQQIILVLLAVMLAVFTAFYAVSSNRIGFLYHDTILSPTQGTDGTTYSGKINGQDAQFLVTNENAVTFCYGSKVYGPYTAKVDPSAIPEKYAGSFFMTGMEVRDKNEILFRGGVYKTGGNDGYLTLIQEDGSMFFSIAATTSNGIIIDSDGNVFDPMKPSVSTILELMSGPELTSKVQWPLWLCGVFLLVFTAVSILFADVFFRWHLSFRIRDVEYAEPSDWELASRYISWTILPVFALAVFIMGLR